MNEKTAARLRKRAVLSAARMGFTEQSEDFAHDAILEWLEGGGQHQTVDQAVIDAVRRAYGRPGLPGHQLRRNLEQRPKRMDALARLPGHSVNRDSVHDFERLIQPLGSVDRAIVCLNYVWGFKEIEIAAIFGITESRISQRLSSAVSRIAQRERKRGQPKALSPNEEQARREREASGQVESMGEEEKFGISPGALEKVPEELLGTFGEDTF